MGFWDGFFSPFVGTNGNDGWLWTFLLGAWDFIVYWVSKILSPDALFHAATTVLSHLFEWVLSVMPSWFSDVVSPMWSFFSGTVWHDMIWLLSYFINLFVDVDVVRNMIEATLLAWPVYAVVRLIFYVKGHFWSSPSSE